MTRVSLDFDGLRPATPALTDVHRQWRAQVREFADRHIAPYIDEWDAAGTFPDALYGQAAAAGVLGFGFPEPLGGCRADADLYHRVIFAEELHRFGTGVVFADLATHWIGLPPVVEFGSEAVRDKVAREILGGEKRIAFAVTEPAGGSDVSAITTVAAGNDKGWTVDGTKTLISGGMRADYILTAVRTGEPGMKGISLLLIDAESDGVDRKPVSGLAWYNRSIATIEFCKVAVPTERLVGDENAGFAALARQFNIERVSGVAATLAMSRVALSHAIAFAQEREAFGRKLTAHQVLRHKLVDMLRQVRASYAYLDHCVGRFHGGDIPVADLSMLKVQATRTLEYCARECLHIVGGSDYVAGGRLERILRESRIFALGGGTEEILNDLAARQIGI